MSDPELRQALIAAREALSRAHREHGYAAPVLAWDGNAWGPIESDASNFLESVKHGNFESAEHDAERLLWALLNGFGTVSRTDSDYDPIIDEPS